MAYGPFYVEIPPETTTACTSIRAGYDWTSSSAYRVLNKPTRTEWKVSSVPDDAPVPIITKVDNVLNNGKNTETISICNLGPGLYKFLFMVFDTCGNVQSLPFDVIVSATPVEPCDIFVDASTAFP